MTKTRHRAREVALQILYRYEVNEADGKGEPPTGLDLANDLKRHFEHFQVDESFRAFSAELVAGTLLKRPEIDKEIEKRATNWKMTRMSVIDRSLLRMSLYELSHFPDTPKAVVIDEAIELAKQFGTQDSAAFINGILDARI